MHAASGDFRLAKKAFGLFRQFLQSAARIICSPMANEFHTCSLSGVFVHVHAAAENDSHFFRRFRGELCEAFFSLLSPDACRIRGFLNKSPASGKQYLRTKILEVCIMIPKRLLSFLLALGCLSGLAGTAAAAEVESGASYCFSAADFAAEEDLIGICITDLPGEDGVLCLGTRILQPGDILTAEQLSRMTFSPAGTEENLEVAVGYLPIYKNHVAEESKMTLSILGKEDKAPVAEDAALETYKNLPATGKLKVSDPEGQPMTYTVIRQPKRGSLEIGEDGTFTYTPRKNKVGVDSFVYTAADPAGKISREATVTITILKPSDAKQYQDTIGSDCRFAAEWMRHTGIFSGENLAEKPCFGPEKQVTRGEFVTMLVKTLDIPVEEGLVYTGYTDEVPVWLQPYLAAAVRSGLTAGLDHPEVFAAEETITTADAALMIANGLELQEVFSGDGEEPVTRAMAAKLMYRASCEREQQKMDTIM